MMIHYKDEYEVTKTLSGTIGYDKGTATVFMRIGSDDHTRHYRSSLADFLRGLGVTAEDCRKALEEEE